jgi:steroid delta-isomerase-like uncharacterized protein
MIALENQTQAVALRWMQEIWADRNLSRFDELHSDDFVDHSPAGRPSDRQGYFDGVAKLFQAFPDFHAVVEDLVLDSAQSKVAIRWSAIATHLGCFAGKLPTGRKIRFRGIEILRVSNGLIVDRWGEWDELAILNQIESPPGDGKPAREGA